MTSFQLLRAGHVTLTSVFAPRQVPNESCAAALSPGMNTPLAQPRPERTGIVVSAVAVPAAVGPATRPAAMSAEVAIAGSFLSTRDLSRGVGSGDRGSVTGTPDPSTHNRGS